MARRLHEFGVALVLTLAVAGCQHRESEKTPGSKAAPSYTTPVEHIDGDEKWEQWQARKGPLSAEDVARLRKVRGAQISPDGKHIAYTVERPRTPFTEPDGKAWTQLHVVSAEGNSRPFVLGKVNVGSIQWAPDSSGISYLDKRPGDPHRALYFIPIDGGESRRILVKEGIQTYSWHPDGKRLAVVATDPQEKDAKARKEKGFGARILEEGWQPVRLWFITPDLTGEGRSGKEVSAELDGIPSGPVWSPTGDRIAVALAPTPHVDDKYMERRLHVLEVGADSAVKMGAEIKRAGKLGTYKFSPDGKHLAFIGAEDRHDPAAGRVMVADVADGTVRDLVPELEAHAVSLAWQDPETLLYVAHRGMQSDIARVNLSGTGAPLRSGQAGEPVFTSLSLSQDGQRMAMVGSTPAHPSEVFVGEASAAAPERLTDLNPWLVNRTLAEQEAITHKSRDGLDIGGVLLKPLQGKGPAPLVLIVHGGPESHVPNGWVTSYGRPGQVLAGAGYAVFYPNYRGSTGRGVEFSKLGQADYGGKEFDDLVDGIAHLEEAGIADKAKVGITGGSYGGFASAWGATKLTEHFAASVMFVGISDQISKAGTTDIPKEMEAVHARKWVYDDWQWFLERSPIFYAKQGRTPILIVHGESDPRVHPSQSLELHRHLKLHGNVPVRLVLYPGEGHGNRKAAARYDYTLRLIRWMDHYLRGPGGEPPPVDLEYPLEASKSDEG